MKKFLGLLMCALFVAAGAVFVACSDDDEEATNNAVTTAIAEIKASNTAYMGVSDFTALTFSDFSNATNDPIYQLVTENESATGERYRVPLNNSADIKKDNRYLLKTGHTKATLSGSSVACWSTPREDRPIGLGTIRVIFMDDESETIKRVCANGPWIAELPTSGTIDLGSVKDFIAVKATGAGTVSASVTNYTITVDTGVAALIDSTGKILDSVKLTAKSDAVTPTAQTLSATVSSSGVYMLITSRNASVDGTVNFNSFTFTPSSSNGTSVSYLPDEFASKTVSALFIAPISSSSTNGNSAVYFFSDNTFVITYSLVDSENNPIQRAVGKGTYVVSAGNFTNGTITITLTHNWTSSGWKAASNESDTLSVANGSFTMKDATYIKQ